jgi:hypothetical protein
MSDVVRVVVIMNPSRAVPKDAAWTVGALASATTVEPFSSWECIVALMVVFLSPTNRFDEARVP